MRQELQYLFSHINKYYALLIPLCIIVLNFSIYSPISALQNAAVSLPSSGSVLYRGNRYVVFYAWLHDGDGNPNSYCQRIGDARPTILFTYSLLGMDDWREPYQGGGSVNLTPNVVNFLHGKDVAVYSYVATEWGLRPLANILDQITRDKQLNIDGIKIDEAYAFAEGLTGLDSD